MKRLLYFYFFLIGISFSYAPPPYRLPYFENFETTSANEWVGSSGNENDNSWTLGTPNKATIQGAYSGTRAWITGTLTGQYDINEYSILTSPVFDFSNVYGIARLSLVIRYYTEQNYDGAQIQYTIDNGVTWTAVGAQNDLINWYNSLLGDGDAALPLQPAWSAGSDSGWVNASHVLPASLARQSAVQFRVVFGSDISVTHEGFAFDDFQLSVPSTGVLCPTINSPSTGLVLTSTIATFSWTRAAGEVADAPFGYFLYLDTVNPPVSFIDVGYSTNFTTILAATSTYYWRVVAVGYNGTTSTGCELRTLVTPVEPVISTLPYAETFETSSGYWIPIGTSSSWEYGTPNKSVITAAHSGTKVWVTGGLTGKYNNNEQSYLLSPAFDLSAISQPLVFSVWIYYYTDTAATSLYDGANLEYTLDEGATWVRVGAYGDATWYNSPNITGFSPKADAWGGNSGGYVSSSHILGTDVLGKNPVHFRINFGSDFAGVFDGVAIDDIQLDYAVIAAPQCPQLLPTEVSDPVTLKWQPAAGDTVVVQRYLVYYGLSVPPTTLLYNGTMTNVTTPMLRSGTTYYWSVTALGFANTPSTNCAAVSFTTLVLPTVTLPYFEDFEASSGNWTTSGTLSSWVWGSPHKTTITSAYSGTNAWINGGLAGQYNNNERSYVVSPIVNYSSVTVPTYVSYYIQYEVEGGTSSKWDGANLQYSVDSQQTWTTLGLADELHWYNASNIIALNQPGWNGHTTGWQLAAHLLPLSLNGQPEVIFRIQFGSDSTGLDDGVAFDDFTVAPVSVPTPLCPVLGPVPTGSPATVTWTRNQAENDLNPRSYILYFGTTNPPTTPVYNVTGFLTNYSYTYGVPAGFTYYYSVVPVGASGAQASCPTYSFTVPVVSIPHTQTFEAGQSGWQAQGQDSSWAFGTPNKTDIQGAYSGVNAWVNGGLNGTYNTDELSYLYSPAFTFGNINAPTFVAFAINYNTEQAVSGLVYDGINFQYTIDYGATWITVGVSGDANWYNTNTISAIPDTNDRRDGFGGRSGGYIIASHILPTTLSQLPDVRFRFQFGSDFSNNLAGVAIDDFTIQLVPSNTAPKCAIFDGAVGNPPVISWHKDPTESLLLPLGYAVYLGRSNPPTTLVASGIQTDFHAGLALPGTTYYLRIVPYGFNNLTTTCNVVSFAVETAPMASFPYYENFEAGTGGWGASANPENPSGLVSSWAFGTPASPRTVIRASTGLCWTSGGLNGTSYPRDEDSYVTSPIFDFTSLTSDPFISLSISYDTETDFDGARLEVITPTTGWTVVGTNPAFYSDSSVASFNDEVAWSGRSVPWTLVSTAAPSVAGTIARFRIHFASDDSAGFEGFAFDNFAIQTTPFWTQPTASTSAPTSAQPTSAATSATSQPITPPTDTQNNIVGSPSNNQISSGAIAAAIIVPIVVVVIIIAVVVYVFSKRRTPVNKKVAVAEHELDEVENRRAAAV